MDIPKIEELEERIQKIEERNQRVEQAKTWETSIIRRVAIAILPYATIVTFFIAASLPHPWVNAVVPTLAFILSTLSLEMIRKKVNK